MDCFSQVFGLWDCISRHLLGVVPTQMNLGSPRAISRKMAPLTPAGTLLGGSRSGRLRKAPKTPKSPMVATWTDADGNTDWIVFDPSPVAESEDSCSPITIRSTRSNRSISFAFHSPGPQVYVSKVTRTK
eukprot:TRINITY_DN20890_c0_g1_i2.p1 TRINITY_DN20890_c0_g1~~TRINITY_DN20890_c0_g1_i2.p1  ORF type:complete len:130 (-),score=7.06 TRINITY_DN20890_c0_g1_i2:243-632(-)